MNEKIKLAGILLGDLEKDHGARVKYGYLFDALKDYYDLIGVYDVTFKGLERWWNALQVFDPNPSTWKERFYKNVPAFKRRSELVSCWLNQQAVQADLVFQLGVLFDAHNGRQGLPNVIYTDYTSILSARKSHAGRSAFKGNELYEWLNLEKQAYHKAAIVFTRSKLVARSLVGDYDVPADRIAVVGGGVNFARLPVLIENSPQHPPTALFIGKEFYRKGGDLLVQAFAEVWRKIPQARLVMVTEIPTRDNLNIEGIDIIEPTWDRNVIETLFRESDVFVLPSRLETWGDVLLEAMAYGLPCIGVNTDAMSEIIVDEETGLLIQQEDIAGLANGLIRLFEDPALRRQFGLAGRKRVESNFTWSQVAKRMNAFIECIIFNQLDHPI